MSTPQALTSDTEYGTGHKTLKSYMIGFSLSLLLTIIPFVLVGMHLLEPQVLFVAISVLAVMQLYVQVVFFLRLNASPKGRWNLMSFLFTIAIVVILVVGSLWIMYNLNYNMGH
jgi:cytochrome o ubiquinol oxidase operon protein cyoD